MAIKPSGPIGLGTDLPAEFGGTAPFSLSQYYRGGGRVPDAPQNAAVPTSGAISLGEFYNTINVLTLVVDTTVTNYNIYNEFVAKYGAPSGAVPVRLDITENGIAGGSGAPALNVGQFPAGTTIEIYNSGKILGYGGAANGGAAGDAVYALYGGQVMRFFNQPGGQCFAGGGGGGHGGTGGAGGGGSYTVDVDKGPGACVLAIAPCENYSCSSLGGYCSGGCVGGGPCTGVNSRCLHCMVSTTQYSSGGSGGGGGNGGVGRGFNQSNTAGDNGAGGSAGGTNAGAGGQGGHGGAGGDWGAVGATGETGRTGANGNNGSGQGGTPGAEGGAGGRYYVRGGADFQFINNGGETAGGVA